MPIFKITNSLNPPSSFRLDNRHMVIRNNLSPGAVYAMHLYAVPEMLGNNHASTSSHLGLLPLSEDKEVPPLPDARMDYVLAMSN